MHVVCIANIYSLNSLCEAIFSSSVFFQLKAPSFGVHCDLNVRFLTGSDSCLSSGFHCLSGRRRPENVSILSSLVNLPRCEVILPSCVAWRPLCHNVNLPRCEVNLSSCVARRPLCHKVNLPRCEVNLSSCVDRRPLCHKVNLPSCVVRQPLCHKVNLPRCEARWRHLIMTCDIFGTG